MAEAEKLLLQRVGWARDTIIQNLLDHSLSLAPAAAMMGDAAPAYVKAAGEIALLDDNADHEKPALRFLLAVLLHPCEASA